ncbi:hypothetical protein TNCV_2912821 [Trichonephila clavipes]|nr:hypothetical protein TNCV_2912821 [Trichonephila clavipes]
MQCYGCGTPGVVKSKQKIIPTEFLVLPEAKGNKTLLGLGFLDAAGIFLDIQGGKWYFSGNLWKHYKFFKKTLEDITLSAFLNVEREEGKNLSPEQARKLNILLDKMRHVSNQGESPCLLMNPDLKREITPNCNVSLQGDSRKETGIVRRKTSIDEDENITNLVTKFGLPFIP